MDKRTLQTATRVFAQRRRIGHFDIEKYLNQMPHPKQPKCSTLRNTPQSAEKKEVLPVRMPPTLIKKLREKARIHTQGNVSRLIRHYCYEGLKRKRIT